MSPVPPKDPISQGLLTPSDRSLVLMIKDGDESAANALYHRYARRVFGLVESKLGAKLRATTEPEDVVQSVFKSIFRGMQSGNYDAPPGSTLWNLLAVIAVNKLRRRGTHQTAQRRDISRTTSLELVDETTLVDSSSLEFLEICVHEILQSLRPLDREILSLRMDGYQVHEISERTKRTLRTVERSLQRSRERLAILLLEDDSGSDSSRAHAHS